MIRIFLALLLFSTISVAKDIRLTWGTPTEREDESAIQEIQGYNLYYTLNNVLQDTISIDASLNTYTVQDIQEGTHTFQISAIESNQEGEISNPYSLSTSTAKTVKMLLTLELVE